MKSVSSLKTDARWVSSVFITENGYLQNGTGKVLPDTRSVCACAPEVPEVWLSVVLTDSSRVSVPCHVKFGPSLWQAGGAYFVITAGAENMEVLNSFVFLADVSLLFLLRLVLDRKRSWTRVQLK